MKYRNLIEFNKMHDILTTVILQGDTGAEHYLITKEVIECIETLMSLYYSAIAFNGKYNSNYISKLKIEDLINQIDNDIYKTKKKYHKGVTSFDANHIDDYAKCRLEAYITKSNDIKNRLILLLGE